MAFLVDRFELDIVREIHLPRFGLLRATSHEADGLRARLLRHVMACEAIGIAVAAHASCSRATALPRGPGGFAALEATVGAIHRNGWTDWVIGLWLHGDGSTSSIEPSEAARGRRVG